MLDVSKVLVGAPDQLTTGAVFDAPLNTKLPTSAVEALDEAFTSSGYITSDGVQLTPDRSTNDITDWSGATVRTLLSSFNATITWTEMQMSYEALCHAFGSGNVRKTAATAEHGAQVVVDINSSMPEARSWVFKMKDGSSRVLIVVPNGQVTAVGDISFTSSDPIGLALTLNCHPDASGNCIYIYIDDGVVSA